MPNLRTPIYDFHIKAGAKMVEYAGWDMPLLYTGIIPEHIHTRTSASVFDVSHMGRLKFTGKGAEAFLQRICTRNLSAGRAGQSMYSLVCNAAGFVLDDVIVSRFEKHWYMVCNAANRQKMLAWFAQQPAELRANCTIEDETLKTAMVAIQGPKAVEMLDSVLPDPVSEIRRYHFETMRYMMMIQFTVFRSGYTGEDGAEIICGTSAANMAVGYLLKDNKSEHQILKPAGLGARDTLRMEAGMPLYGHELTEETDPLSANLGWAVDLSKDFIGGDALRKIHADGPKQRLVGLFIEGPRSARQGMTLSFEGKSAGVVTSGTMSPTLNRCIAMAHVNAELLTPNGPPPALMMDLRGTPTPATVTPLPFYKRGK